MQTIRWYRLLALGVLAAPTVVRAQAPQPVIKEIAAIPGVDVDEAIRMPNAQVVIYGANDSIWAFNVMTKHASLITRGWDDELTISRSGDRIAYARTDQSGDTDFIWSIRIDPQTGESAGAPQKVSTNPGDSPSFSPDGQWLAFAPDSPKGSVAVVPVTGGVERIVARYGHSIGETSWSADGKWIYAEVHGGKDSASSISRVAAAGGTGVVSIAVPFRSSEGSIDGQIAFYWPASRDSAPDIMHYVTASGTRGDIRLAQGTVPGFSLASAQSILMKTTRPTSVQVLDLASGAIHAAGPANVRGAALRWSPDGTRLAMQSGSAANPVLVIVHRDGSTQRSYSVPGLRGGMQWSPDGTMMAFTLESVSLASSTSRRAAPVRSHRHRHRCPAFCGARTASRSSSKPTLLRPAPLDMSFSSTCALTARLVSFATSRPSSLMSSQQSCTTITMPWSTPARDPERRS